MKRTLWLLCWTAFGAQLLDARAQPCATLPPLLAERLHHLDTAYPEWNLPNGVYCFAHNGTQGFWTYGVGPDTLYSPPIPWQGELSAPMARSLQALGTQVRAYNPDPARTILLPLGAVTFATLAVLFVIQGPGHYERQQVLQP